MENINKKPTILYLATHPIQNTKPYKLLNKHPLFQYLVVYLLKPAMVNTDDEENINHGAFDIDVINGYQNIFLKNQWPFKWGFSFFKLCSFHLVKYVKNATVLVIYGHNNASFWIAMLAAKFYRKRIILTTDITYIEANAKSAGWKLKLKPAILRFLYNNCSDGVFVPSTASKLYLENSIKINPSKITITPYVVDEDYISALSNETDIKTLRKQLAINDSSFVFIFCAKFIDRKRPMDAIKAFAKLLKNTNSTLLMVGDGPLINEMKVLSVLEGIQNQVLFTGFVKYSQLPKYYTISNCLVFCSDHEPFGLPVNEALLCGIPVIVSDRIGCRLDLVDENITGWIYKSGDVDELAEKMEYVTSMSPEKMDGIKLLCKQKMKTWSSEINVQRQLDYFKKINIC